MPTASIITGLAPSLATACEVTLQNLPIHLKTTLGD
jgi:hypothetical protein